MKKEYYAREMKLNKQPTVLINALDEMRVDMKKRLNKEMTSSVSHLKQKREGN